MRIVEPQHLSRIKKNPKSKSHKKLIYFFIVTVIALLFFALFSNSKKSNDHQLAENNSLNQNTIQPPVEIIPKTGLRNFSGNEFRLLYDNILLPNTEKIPLPPEITSNDTADTRIRQLAGNRGYKLRLVSSSVLPTIDGIPLQPQLHTKWKLLQQDALSEGLQMSIVSAYRSIDDQRTLFLSRLRAEGVSINDVVSGSADAEVIRVLVTSAIPGYSKHHSGYTFDLLCSGWEFEDFKNSPCNSWLETNNYEKAKKYGFIPSYPIDADLQGPDPEAWEYVYVGDEVLNY